MTIEVRDLLRAAILRAARGDRRAVKACIMFDFCGLGRRAIIAHFGSNRLADATDWVAQGHKLLEAALPPREDLP